jgi:RimJ/RimL family protein N-acetyltransferase
MREKLETLRLCIEPFTSDDAAAAFAWFSDPEVMRFIPTGPDRSMEETEKRLARYIEHQPFTDSANGSSVSARRDNPSGTLVSLFWKTWGRSTLDSVSRDRTGDRALRPRLRQRGFEPRLSTSGWIVSLPSLIPRIWPHFESSRSCTFGPRDTTN